METDPNVRFEFLKAMAMKSDIFWDITPCILPIHKPGKKFGRKYVSLACYLLGSFFVSEDGDDEICRNVG
jgi:hypothetical protein